MSHVDDLWIMLQGAAPQAQWSGTVRAVRFDPCCDPLQSPETCTERLDRSIWLFCQIAEGDFTILEGLGWNEHFEQQASELTDRPYAFGRVAAVFKDIVTLLRGDGVVTAAVSGRFRHETLDAGSYPAIGDFVAFTFTDREDRATIHHVLRRTTCFSRKVAGARMDEQVMAANVDLVCLVMAAGQDFNPRRLERFLTAIWESGAEPVVLLSKMDLCDDPGRILAEARAGAPLVPIVAVSAASGSGMDGLRELLTRNGVARTLVMTGASGVGKSTLINTLLGSQKMAVQAVRDGDERGRHTTTHRELHVVPTGGLLIDTPGIRELQLWSGDTGLADAFADIEDLSVACRFRDCRHDREPGCAVQAAIALGTLEPQRLANFRKLERELVWQAEKEARQARAQGSKQSRRIFAK